MALVKQITCPFCFKMFESADVEFRCINRACTGRAQDHKFAEARDISTPPLLPRAFEAPKPGWFARLVSPPTEAACDQCGVKTTKRLCPYCHFELSHDAGLIEDHIIAIIGGRETGKGHYIATLIHRLEQEVGAHFQFSLRMVGDETRRRFEESYRDPLFRRKQLLQATPSAVVDTQVKAPMIFRLTLGNRRRLRAVNLSFFDSAGEDMQSLDTLSTEVRYITSAAGIIFLLDPLQIEAVRQRTLENARLPTVNPMSEPQYIVQRLRELFERHQNLQATAKIKTPVAFVLSKSDTLLPIIEPGSALRSQGEHWGYFNQTDAQSVHTEVENYLRSWIGTGFTRNIDIGFANYRFFGASSLGRPPDASGKLDTIAPLRVEDPFLWILYELGLVPGRKEK